MSGRSTGGEDRSTAAVDVSAGGGRSASVPTSTDASSTTLYRLDFTVGGGGGGNEDSASSSISLGDGPVGNNFYGGGDGGRGRPRGASFPASASSATTIDLSGSGAALQDVEELVVNDAAARRCKRRADRGLFAMNCCCGASCGATVATSTGRRGRHRGSGGTSCCSNSRCLAAVGLVLLAVVIVVTLVVGFIVLPLLAGTHSSGEPSTNLLLSKDGRLTTIVGHVTVTECALITLNLTSSHTSNLPLISSFVRALIAKTVATSFEYQLDKLMQKCKYGQLLSTRASFANRSSSSKEAVFDIELAFLVDNSKQQQQQQQQRVSAAAARQQQDSRLLADVRRLFVQTGGNLDIFVIDLSSLDIDVLYQVDTTVAPAGDSTATHSSTEPFEPIFLPVCMDQSYSLTCYPNVLHHGSQIEASDHGLEFLPLLSSSCSEYIIRFWCLLFVPDCTMPGRPLSPCRSFCQSIRNECPRVRDMLDNLTDSCNLLPDSNDPTECVLYPPDSQSSGCQEVEVTECRQLGHAQTAFPNALGHRGPHSAAESWWRLLHIGSAVHCSEHLTAFGCAVVYPKCVQQDRKKNQTSPAGRLVGPCRSLCEVVQGDCGFFLKVAGLLSVAHFDCSQLPQSLDPQVCVGGDITGSLQNKRGCADGEFACDDASGACISAEWVCDGRWDCQNGSDERNCAVCVSGSRCNSGWCIDADKVCDGAANCRDAEDERDCLKVRSEGGSASRPEEGGGVLEMYDASKSGWTPVCLSTVDWNRYVQTDLCSSRHAFDLSSEMSEEYMETMTLLRNRSNCSRYEPLKIACSFSGCAHPSPVLLQAAVASTEARLTDDFFIDADDWPWIVSLHGGPKKLFFCGASIIDDMWLLTAAHCVGGLSELDEWTVMSGHSRRHSHSVTRQSRRLSRVVVHPEYSSQTMINDVALLRLDRPFQLDTAVRRLCLPPLDYVPQAGQRCYVGGWGKTSHDDLLYSKQARLRVLKVFPLSSCESFFAETSPNRLFCTTGRHGVDVCQGDSGSAVLCEPAAAPPSSSTAAPSSGGSGPTRNRVPDHGRLILAGVVSYGADTDCGNPAVPSVHTAIASFVPWIRDVMAAASDVTTGRRLTSAAAAAVLNTTAKPRRK